MQDLKISMKAKKSWINMIKRIDGIFGFKVLYGEFEEMSFNSGRECGEALDPMSNLYDRLERSVVLVEDKSSSLSEQCLARESVLMRSPTRLATISTPSSSPPVPSPNNLKPCPNLDSFTPISHKARSYSLSRSSSGASSIHNVADHPEPPFKDEVTQVLKKELTKTKELLEVSNTEIRRTNAANDSHQAKELELLERQVVAQEAMFTLNMNNTQKEAAAKKHYALVEARAKASSILFDVEELDKVVNKTRDWKNASDYTVKKAMRNIVEWKEEMKKIIETKREFMILVGKNEFTENDDVKEDRVEREVEDLKADMDAAIISIENEDNFRALYTLDTTPVRDPVKLPKFSGKDGEDFHMFKQEIDRGFVHNRIPRANQLSKLRECLSGAALAFVPKFTVMTIDEAWAVLKKSYGDAYRIIKYRKAELMKVGKFPKVNTKDRGGYNQQIFWFLKVENLLKSVLDLGNKHPEYNDSAFSFEFISTVVMMFPQRLRIKLHECPGKKGELLKNMCLKIENLREVAQGLQFVVEASTASGGGPGHVSRQQGQ